MAILRDCCGRRGARDLRVFALLCFAVISASCGRIGFDLTAPSGDGDGDSGAGGDSGQGGEGGTSGGAGGSGGSGAGGQAGEAGASGSAGMSAGNGGTAGDEVDGGIDGPPPPVDVCVLESCASDFDRCPNDPAKTSPGICGCDVSDEANDDDDNMPDCIDLCAGMPDVLPDGTCGCPAAAGDLDGDGVQNCMDWCPDDGDKTEPLVCGCDISEADDDQDGMPTCADPCSADPEKVLPGVCGCGVIESDVDTDGDDEPDCTDACSGLNDATYVPDDSCGAGYCNTTNTASTCVGGLETSCMPGAALTSDDATCDLVDDDCDGVRDDEYPVFPSSCGVGACARTGTISCVSGEVFDSCAAASPAIDDTTCDGADDDCDTSSDEDFSPRPSTCGVGACASTGTVTCAGGVEQDSCTVNAASATDTTCDGIDDDCDGQNDEDYGPTTTTCGTGACVRGGVTSCVGGDELDSCAPGTGAANDASCDGVDQDCSGAADEDYVVTTTNCGTGLCAATGQRTCVNGTTQNSCVASAPAANDASCNGIDNDCNGTNDEDYVTTTTNCGVGSCSRTGQLTCVSGAPSNSCTPGAPAANDASCDGVDQDCNGLKDEDYVPTATSCGIGACMASGQLVCTAGAVTDTCSDGSAGVDNDCDGVDDDCDGPSDEHFVTQATSCGVGACAASGQLTCSMGMTQNSCTPGAPAANDASCNNVDNDCNGQRDEDYVVTATSCGVGACAAAGQNTCVTGSVVNTCTPGTPAANDASCDNVDNDCNGTRDEDYVVTATSCGVGACAANGQRTCVTGSVVNSCTPGTPAANDASCNNVDNDCNGQRDEDYVVTATSCGVGACAASGQNTCVAGSVVNSCTAGTPAANDATCNNIDEDCNGTRDEDYAVTATSCGLGQCAANGQNTCSMGSVVNTCTPGAPRAGLDDPTYPGNGVDNNCNGTIDEDSVPPCSVADSVYSTTGLHNITVPAGCTNAVVRIWGGGGASGAGGGFWGGVTGGLGGPGGYATRTFSALTTSTTVQLRVGPGAVGCGAGGANVDTTYSGGAAATSRSGNGVNGQNNVNPQGGNGGVSSSGGDGGKGFRGGGGGGGGGGPAWNPFGTGGAAGAATYINVGGTLMLAGGGGGGGGAGSNITSAGEAGGNGGSGCSGAGTAPSTNGGGGGGGGRCDGTTNQAGTGRNPHVPAGVTLPANTAIGGNTTANCSAGGAGYAIIDWQP